MHCLGIVLLTNAVSRCCSLLHLTLHLRGSGPKARQRSSVGKGEILVIPHAISPDLCDDLLNKLDSLLPHQFGTLATQPEIAPRRRLFQLGATGELYHRCKHEGAKLLFRLGSIDYPVYKPTLVEALPGAKQGTFHRDFSMDGGLSINFCPY